jgi:protocatechuate 3,4-dioxygenase, beta subunit
MDRREVFAAIGLASLAAACGTRATSEAGPHQSPPRPDLYNCDGCEGALERDAHSLGWQTRMAPVGEAGESMRIEGRVLQSDGRTPAAAVVVYAYQTNAEGRYANGSNATEWSRRHGRLRGWVRTGADGRYAFDTIKPAPYPNDNIPAHVHLTVVEPGRRPYYIDDIVFDGEFGVTPSYRRRQELRGGSGIVTLRWTAEGTWLAIRNIILERHPT